MRRLIISKPIHNLLKRLFLLITAAYLVPGLLLGVPNMHFAKIPVANILKVKYLQTRKYL
ncbi:MAG: hypothetical protein PVH61_02445 [Candidatus Aminicenantes bacterium]|jgi:hypothetical protein